jgi:hypothetical protein
LSGKICQQGVSSPATATASIREGELEKNDPAPRGISGVLLSFPERSKKKLLHFHFCCAIVLQMVEMPVEWLVTMGDQMVVCLQLRQLQMLL